MPSITINNTVRLFASASDGPTICLAFKDFDAGDGDSLVLIHSPGDAQPWRRIELPFDVMDVALTPFPETQGARYIALASTGEAIVLAEPPIVTRVNAEGIFRQIEPGKGMLSAFDVAGGILLALGRGGQAYRFENGAWRSEWTTPPIEEDATDHINFLCAAKKGRETYFGGVSEPQNQNEDAFLNFLMADDDAELVLNEVRRNYGTLWLLENTRWRKIEIPTSGTITNILEWDGNRLFASDNRGLVVELTGSDQMEEIYVNGDQKSVADLVGWRKQLVVVLTDEIIALDLAAGTDESYPVPDGFEALQHLHPFGDDAWLVDWRGLARWNGSDWDEIIIPSTLLR